MEAAEPGVAAARDTTLETLLVSLAAMTALADFCLWRPNPGVSVGVFALGAMAIIVLNRRGIRWTWRGACLVALICGAVVESAIGVCFSNVLVLMVLMPALAAETYYEPLRSGWSRWSEGIWSMAKTPLRWVWLLREVAKETRHIEPMPPGSVRNAARILWIVVPGLAVTLLFALILGSGNAIFAKLTADWTAAVCDWIFQHLTIWRFLFWGFVAWVALPLLRPSPAPKSERFWTREIPRLPELASSATARMQSAVTLGLLNALFCCVNTIDVVYLWARQALPADVSYSAFVHRGVFSLIVAVLFSAVLLAGMFQQARSVSGWTPLRLLGLVWIGQNLVLLAGVLLRVKLYVDAFNLTVTRVNLVFFLALVAIGFVLLAIHVWRQRTLGWLVGANVLAAFFLFYTVQFLDTAGFVANYNVDLWQNKTHRLDFPYLEYLGPPAYEAIGRVARSDSPEEAGPAAAYLDIARRRAREQLEGTPWAAWQLRTVRYQRKVLFWTGP